MGNIYAYRFFRDNPLNGNEEIDNQVGYCKE